MTAPDALKVESLGKKFGDFTAVEDVSFAVRPGEDHTIGPAHALTGQHL